MRIKLPNSQIISVTNVEPFVEKAVTINGKQRVIRQVSNGSEKPTGFVVEMPKALFGARYCTAFGNFSAKVLDEVLTNLAKEGYADLSGYSYQKLKEDYTFDGNVVIDGGESAPYAVINTIGLLAIEGSTIACGGALPPTYNVPVQPRDVFDENESEFDAEYDCEEE